MFTKQQLEFLVSNQSQDDWSPNYFPSLLEDNEAEFLLSEVEHKALTQYVNSLSLEQVWHLQMALNHLNQLPDFHQ